MLKEFKAFIAKGNVLDMAVGVIIGGAFGKIVSSLVADIFTPLISLLTGDVNFSEAKLVMRPEVLNEAGEVTTPALTLNYGMFLQNIIDFLIIAICVFAIVKIAVAVRKKAESISKKQAEEEKTAEPPKPSNEEILLTEIRDLLKEKNN